MQLLLLLPTSTETALCSAARSALLPTSTISTEPAFCCRNSFTQARARLNVFCHTHAPTMDHECIHLQCTRMHTHACMHAHTYTCTCIHKHKNCHNSFLVLSWTMPRGSSFYKCYTEPTGGKKHLPSTHTKSCEEVPRINPWHNSQMNGVTNSPGISPKPEWPLNYPPAGFMWTRSLDKKMTHFQIKDPDICL